jgi:predicted Zn-dependent protease with MMP-like domain
VQDILRSAENGLDPAMLRVSMVLVAGTLIGVAVLIYLLCRSKPATTLAPLPRPHLSAGKWAELFARVERVVATTRAELPQAVGHEVERLTVIMDKWAPRMLGSYHQFEPGRVSSGTGPIFIFVGSVYQNCELHGLEFDDEIRTTYLHELGHHLGLSEVELTDRGL